MDRRVATRRAGRTRDHPHRRVRAAAGHDDVASRAGGTRGARSARVARVRVALGPRDRGRDLFAFRVRDDGGDSARARGGTRRRPACDRRVRGPDRRPARGGGGTPPRAAGRFSTSARRTRILPLAGRVKRPLRAVTTAGAGGRRVGRDRRDRRRARELSTFSSPMEDALIPPQVSSRASLPTDGERDRVRQCSLAGSPARSGAGSEARYRVTFEGMGGRQEGDRMLRVATAGAMGAAVLDAGSLVEEAP